MVAREQRKGYRTCTRSSGERRGNRRGSVESLQGKGVLGTAAAAPSNARHGDMSSTLQRRTGLWWRGLDLPARRQPDDAQGGSERASTSLHEGGPNDAHGGSGQALPADDKGVAKLPIVNS
jgi:hypothetical protein